MISDRGKYLDVLICAEICREELDFWNFYSVIAFALKSYWEEIVSWGASQYFAFCETFKYFFNCYWEPNVVPNSNLQVWLLRWQLWCKHFGCMQSGYVRSPLQILGDK